MKKIKENLAIIIIGLIAILFNLFLHNLGAFSLIETKLYDARFKLRGPLLNFDSDVVLVEIDDESYRLIPESYPYSRGRVWANVIKNLTKGKYLWLRNNFSTFTSQFIDTFTIVSLLIIVDIIPSEKFLVLVISGFLFKVIVAILDTPLLYFFVWLFRSL